MPPSFLRYFCKRVKITHYYEKYIGSRPRRRITMAEKVEVLQNGMVSVLCTDGTTLVFRPDCDINDVTAFGKEILERCKGQ